MLLMKKVNYGIGHASGGNEDLWQPTRDLNGDLPGVKSESDGKIFNGNFFINPWNIGSQVDELKKVKVISSSDNFLTPKYPNIFVMKIGMML